jgi:hypothetical protein
VAFMIINFTRIEIEILKYLLSIFPLLVIFLMHFGTVPTMVFLFFILLVKA